MKIASFLAPGIIAFAAATVLAQPSPLLSGGRMVPAGPPPPQGASAASELSKFDLDFPGGTPGALVAAIQKALGKPLNAIIPDEYAGTKLPALRMNSVDVDQLFSALQAATSRTVIYTSGSYYGGAAYGGYKSYQQTTTSCGFKSVDGKKTDDTIWYFYVNRPALPEGSSVAEGGRVCRFYSLAPYLQRRLTVDNITTAIETGWKMLGEKSPAAIKFHKDTQLLIAVGEPSALETIDAVLKALEEPRPAAPSAKPAPAAKAAERSSTPEEK